MSGKDFRNLVPLITESRLSRQYAAIRERVPATPPRRRFWAGWVVAAALASVLAVLAFRAIGLRSSTLADDAVVESGPSADGARPTSITLAEGSRVELGASTRARLTSARPKAIRIDLERGSVDIEATHVDGRTFVVGAGGYEVRVVGTHFVVARTGDAVAVDVQRGQVDVTSEGQRSLVSAGTHWPLSATPAPTVAPSATAPSPPARETRETHDPGAGRGAPAEGRSSTPTAMRVAHSPREQYEAASKLEAQQPQAAISMYRELARQGGAWGENALFAAGRLEADRGDADDARRLLADYLTRYPAGPNANDARQLLDRLR
jgi:hypothetical protein